MRTLTSIRLDRAGGSLGATPIEVTPEGFKVYRGTAAFGDVVYEYPERGVNEYVPAAEALAPDIVATLIGKPFTIHHPDDLLDAADPEGVKEHAEGTVRAARADLTKSPPELEVEVVVWTRPAQEDIESGAVVELSPGYRCQEDDAPPGSVGPGGKPFQVIQRRRQYNHLSGVMRARGVTPDGRRARLDEAGEERPRVWKRVDLPAFAHAVYINGPFAGMSEAAADASYPHFDAPEFSMLTPAADAPMTLTPAAPADMDPAVALAMFSPEAAEVLKSLPPEDLAKLVQMAVVREAEAAEHAVEAEAEAQGIPLVQPAEGEPMADQPKIEVEVEPSEEGESEGGESEAPAAEQEDATVPMAPAGLTADAPPPPAAPAASAPATMGDLSAAINALGDKMIEMMKAAMAAQKTDAPRCDAPPAPTPAASIVAAKPAAEAKPKTDAAADQAFVAAVVKRGHRVDSLPEAVAKAVAIVKDHASPGVHALAEKAAASAAKSDRDLLIALFEDADDRRRDALVGEQFAALRLVTDAEDDYRSPDAPPPVIGQRRDAAGNPAGAGPLPQYIPLPNTSANPGAVGAGK